MHWTGTYLPLIVPHFFGSAYYIFLFRQFFLTIPMELSDAATIDGCSQLGILWRIILPLSKPIIVTVGLFEFNRVWSDYLAPLIFLSAAEQFTLALGLTYFLDRGSTDVEPGHGRRDAGRAAGADRLPACPAQLHRGHHHDRPERIIRVLPRERILTACRRGQPDRVPYIFSVTPPMQEPFERETGATDMAEYFEFDYRSVGAGPTRKQTDFRPYFADLDLPPDTCIDEWGVAQPPPAVDDPMTPHFRHRISPLRHATTIAEVEAFPLPDLDADYRFEGMAATGGRLQSAWAAVQGGLGFSTFDHSWLIRGIDQFMMDMAAIRSWQRPSWIAWWSFCGIRFANTSRRAWISSSGVRTWERNGR